jgi:ribosomal protein S18 acetylase RimI-like enzyme
MTVERLLAYSDAFMAALKILMPQLTRFSPIPQKEEIVTILGNPDTSIWIAKDDEERIVGMLTLVIYRTPTGIHAWIEDVVVDKSYRGIGFGKLLTSNAIEYAEQKHAKAISLTSRPERIVANQLYQKMGFELINTNLYRKDL